eukprot:scaffold6622_cov91-Cylindrotheca_fusiformis.AAC.1
MQRAAAQPHRPAAAIKQHAEMTIILDQEICLDDLDLIKYPEEGDFMKSAGRTFNVLVVHSTYIFSVTARTTATWRSNRIIRPSL